jgi:hypothetical protein
MNSTRTSRTTRTLSSPSRSSRTLNRCPRPASTFSRGRGVPCRPSSASRVRPSDRLLGSHPKLQQSLLERSPHLPSPSFVIQLSKRRAPTFDWSPPSCQSSNQDFESAMSHQKSRQPHPSGPSSFEGQYRVVLSWRDRQWWIWKRCLRGWGIGVMRISKLFPLCLEGGCGKEL